MATVSYGRVRIVTKRATVRDDLNARRLSSRVFKQVAIGEWGLWDLFADLITRTSKVNGLDFDPLKLLNADDATVLDAYNKFMDMDATLKDLWEKAVNEENKAVDPIIGPEPLPENTDPNSSSVA